MFFNSIIATPSWWQEQLIDEIGTIEKNANADWKKLFHI